MTGTTTNGTSSSPISDIGVGLISVGWMGQLHSRAYQAVPYVYPQTGIRPPLVPAADTAPDRVVYAREVLGYERGSSDYREVLADPEVDVVSICAPNVLHREIGVAAAEGAKRVWIEKPVGRTVKETAAVAAAAGAAGLATSIGYNYRHAPAVEHSRELIASGALGRITNVRAVFFSGYAAEPKGALSWRFKRERAGRGAPGDLLRPGADLGTCRARPARGVTAPAQHRLPRAPNPADGLGHPLRGDRGRRAGPGRERGLRGRPGPLRRRRPGGGGGRHPGGVADHRRPPVRARLRAVRHRRIAGLELRADERAAGVPGPQRPAPGLHHGARQRPPGRLRPLPAGARDRHGLRRPQGHRGQEVPGRSRRRRAPELLGRRRPVGGRGGGGGRAAGRRGRGSHGPVRGRHARGPAGLTAWTRPRPQRRRARPRPAGRPSSTWPPAPACPSRWGGWPWGGS